MIAGVLIEYSIKTLDKTFDYIVPDDLKNIIKVGHKVKVNFGKQIVEGFVMYLKNELDDSLDYKEVLEIVESTFCLNKELLDLGVFIKEKTLSTLISAYQIMFPKALKASNKTNLNIKTKQVVYLNKKNVDNYILNNKINEKQLNIINILKNNEEMDKSELTSSSLNTLIKNNVVLIKTIEVNRQVHYISEEKKEITLNEYQQEAYEEIINSDNNKILLHGITGSGKTEIYIKLMKKCISENKTAIMLVPEISLTPQIVSRLINEFSSKVAVLHSKLSEGEKYDEYRRIVEGKVDIVVGARSAIFAPLNNIGIIIIDECGSSSFKQENNPKYNAIDVAFERSKTHNAICLMGSATPLIEQYARANKGVFKLVTLDKRVSNYLPTINIVDMNYEVKKHSFTISTRLKDKIKETLNKHEQILILLNRRGYSTFISCSSCGYVWKCPSCDISLIYHKSSNMLRCHYCGYQIPMSKTCPQCKEEAIKDLGLGTEKLEQMIKELFPTSKVLRMDADTTSTKNAHNKIINSFYNKEYDILIGTQMISKGLNFPNVSLVGVINIDNSLNIPDFRSHERTFELLMQTSGRTGRFDLPGKVLVQTFNKEDYVFNCLIKNDYKTFYENEMKLRKILKYPPYYYLSLIKISSNDYNLAASESNKVKKYLSNKLSSNFIVLGPSTASIFRVNGRYYFQILIKYKQEENLLNTLKELNEIYLSDKIKVDITMEPLNI